MPAIPQRLSLVTLGVRDVAASRAFYERLGWVVSSASQEAITFLQLGGIGLGLFGEDDLAEDASALPRHEDGFRGVTLAVNVADEDAVDAAFADALAAGATSIVAPERVFWGGYRGYFADPDGHLWELAHNPFFPLREDGSLELPA